MLQAHTVIYRWIEYAETCAAIELCNRCVGEDKARYLVEMLRHDFSNDFETVNFFAAYAGAGVIGLAYLAPTGITGSPTYRLGGLSVAPEYRRQGIGARLIEGCARRAQEILSEINIPNAIMQLTQSGTAPETYYKRFGFRTVYRDEADCPVMIRKVFEPGFTP
jgi:predicted N-acetyltransferase YhbS